MDPGSGDLGEIVYSGLPGNTVGMATMVDMSEASKPKSGLWAQLLSKFLCSLSVVVKIFFSKISICVPSIRDLVSSGIESVEGTFGIFFSTSADAPAEGAVLVPPCTRGLA